MAKSDDELTKRIKLIEEVRTDKLEILNDRYHTLNTKVELMNQRVDGQDVDIKDIKEFVSINKKDETESERFEKKLKFAVVSLLLTIFIAPIITRVLEKLLFP